MGMVAFDWVGTGVRRSTCANEHGTGCRILVRRLLQLSQLTHQVPLWIPTLILHENQMTKILTRILKSILDVKIDMVAFPRLDIPGARQTRSANIGSILVRRLLLFQP